MIIYAKPIKENRDFKLDTAAKLYAYTCDDGCAQTFSVSAIMREKVNAIQLQNALDSLRKRFPSFFVYLKNGFTWKKLSPVERVFIEKEGEERCRPIDVKDKRPLFRVTYNDYRISFEVFHAVTDGKGAVAFFKTLLFVYLNNCGKNIPLTSSVLNPYRKPDRKELEDSFVTNYQKGGERLKRKEKDAYQYVPNSESGELNVYQVSLSVSELKTICKRYDVTISEYLAAVYTYAFYKDMSVLDYKKPIKVQVPINLRQHFNSVSLRNFSDFVNIEIMPEENLSFDSIVSSVAKQLRQNNTKERVQKTVNANVFDGDNVLSKYAPGFMKKPFIKIGLKLYGERLLTSPMTNLGVVDLPTEMSRYIDSFDAIIGKTHLNKIYSTIISYNGKLNVTFSALDLRCKIPNLFYNIIKTDAMECEEKTA